MDIPLPRRSQRTAHRSRPFTAPPPPPAPSSAAAGSRAHARLPRRTRASRGSRHDPLVYVAQKHVNGDGGKRPQVDVEREEEEVRERQVQKEENEEPLSPSHICPICHLLLSRPVITSCGHYLCRSCMRRWADVCAAQQQKLANASAAVLDVDAPDSDTDDERRQRHQRRSCADACLAAPCPMCRTATTASSCPSLAAALRAAYPRTWAKREAEEAEEQRQCSLNDAADDGGGGSESSGGNNIQTLTLCIGNRHREVQSGIDANVHEWTFFVRPTGRRAHVVDELHVTLHSTFRPRRVVRQRAPFEICRRGWGCFTIVAGVVLKAGYRWVNGEARDAPDGAPAGMLPIEWTLDFDGFAGRGSMRRYTLDVQRDQDWREASAEAERDGREWQRTLSSYRSDGRYEPDDDGDEED